MRRRFKSQSAFSVIELLIVVAIIADLAVIAIPAFARSRQFAQNSRFVSDLRTAGDAFGLYAAEHNGYPPEVGPGIVPAGMQLYLRGMEFQAVNSLGGRWDWDYNTDNTIAQVSTLLPKADDLRMVDIDERMDNGVPATGQFRQRSPTRYSYILE